jgi:5,10-methylene-tetrahydrofolate dehydrogenase/methenyl tetrahydrofolate cyclohydrolase
MMMTAKLIKGTEIREEILEEVQAEVAQIKEKHGSYPVWLPFLLVKIRLLCPMLP